MKDILLTEEDKKIFLENIINPPEPNEALKKAQKNYKKFIKENEEDKENMGS